MRREPPYRRILRLWPIRAQRAASEMDEEIAAHLRMRTDDLVRQGMTPEAAHAEATRRFGDLAEARRRLHAAAREREAALRQRDLLGAVRGDITYALRQARRAPGFTALSLATLALGIGLTTATFTLVRGVLLRPLPFREPERLVVLQSQDSAGNPIPTVSGANWRDWQRETRTLESTAIHAPRRYGVLGVSEAIRVQGELASFDFFRVLGIPFLAGRSFTETEAHDQVAVAVVSEGLWRRLLDADPALRRPLRIEGRDYAVVGVVPAGLEYPAGTELWLPTWIPGRGGAMRNNINWWAIARLSRGSTVAHAASELDGIAASIRARDPAGIYSHGVPVRPLHDMVVGDSSRYLRLLMGAVALVLLIACANLAAANLGRAAVRSREMAVRAALGAGRARLVGQVLIEHGVLALAGGLLGVGLAMLAVRTLLALWGSEVPRASEIAIDPLVLGFALVVSIVTGLATGVAPAIKGSGLSLRDLIASGGRGTARGGRGIPGALLVGVEIALALLLLAGSGLLIRSFDALLSRDLGFDPRVATAELTLNTPRYRSDTSVAVAYWDELLASLRSIPGVKAVGVSNWVPLGFAGSGFIEIAGNSTPNAGADYRAVSEDYFDAMGMRMLGGRRFGSMDGPRTERVAVINRRMAEQYWPNEPAIGQRVRALSMESVFRRPAPWLTIVGVVDDIRHWGLETDVRPEMYVLHRQVPSWVFSMTAVVRGPARPDQLVPAIRDRVRRLDATIPADVGTLEAKLERQLAPRRLTLTLLTGFGGVALLLAAIGVYGMLSYAVSQRTRELAVRAALGAQRGALLRLVAGGALRVIVVGAIAGLVGSYWMTKAMTALLVDVRPTDPVALGGATAALVVVAMVAVVGPARRATRLDPMMALQAE